MHKWIAPMGVLLLLASANRNREVPIGSIRSRRPAARNSGELEPTTTVRHAKPREESKSRLSDAQVEPRATADPLSELARKLGMTPEQEELLRWFILDRMTLEQRMAYLSGSWPAIDDPKMALLGQVRERLQLTPDQWEEIKSYLAERLNQKQQIDFERMCLLDSLRLNVKSA